jgi:integrase/recombinase XerC
MTTHQTAPSSADIDAARLLLSRLGVSPADLLAGAEERIPAPTFAEYIPVVRSAVGDGTRRVYGSYWNRIVEHWGARRLEEPTPSEVNQLAEHAKNNVVTRRNARGGRSAAEHLIAALRCVYRHTENDGHIKPGDNPALKVAKPWRLPSTRRAVPDTRLADINQIAAATGNDPSLDTLLLRLHTETACRRGSALALNHQ